MSAERSQHTPGPWYAYQPAEGRTRIGRSLNGLSADYVCTLFDGPNKTANARLIAAAPELLDALKDTAGYLEAIDNAANQIGERSAIQTKLATIRAAIAKAEGRK